MCHGTGYEDLIEEIEIDVPEGFEYSHNTLIGEPPSEERWESVFSNERIKEYRLFPFPCNIGIETLICEVCGGKGGPFIPFCESAVEDTCFTCNGATKQIKTSITVEQKAGKYIFKVVKEVV